MKRRGFTLIELLVVMAIVATLLAVVAPRYFRHVDHAKEVALRQTLAVVRDAIDKYHGDKGRYPAAIEDMVEQRYLRQAPKDPLTDSIATWKLLPPPNDAAGGIWDVRSGAAGAGSDGMAYQDY